MSVGGNRRTQRKPLTYEYEISETNKCLVFNVCFGEQDYIFALLTGYCDPPEGIEIAEGQAYNPYFPGGAIGMVQQLFNEGVEYDDGKLQNPHSQNHTLLWLGALSSRIGQGPRWTAKKCVIPLMWDFKNALNSILYLIWDASLPRNCGNLRFLHQNINFWDSSTPSPFGASVLPL